MKLENIIALDFLNKTLDCIPALKFSGKSGKEHEDARLKQAVVKAFAMLTILCVISSPIILFAAAPIVATAVIVVIVGSIVTGILAYQNSKSELQKLSEAFGNVRIWPA